jgi:hypothetical protein
MKNHGSIRSTLYEQNSYTGIFPASCALTRSRTGFILVTGRFRVNAFPRKDISCL